MSNTARKTLDQFFCTWDEDSEVTGRLSSGDYGYESDRDLDSIADEEQATGSKQPAVEKEGFKEAGSPTLNKEEAE